MFNIVLSVEFINYVVPLWKLFNHFDVKSVILKFQILTTFWNSISIMTPKILGVDFLIPEHMVKLKVLEHCHIIINPGAIDQWNTQFIVFGVHHRWD